MSESQVFQLARLYYGHLVLGGQRTSETPGVIARTGDVTQAQVAECVRLAKLSPPGPDEVGAAMPGSLGLFRGETTDFILAKAQNNATGDSQVLYILTPLAALRALGGNVLSLRALALMEMPAFATVRANLLPFDLVAAPPLSTEEQSTVLLDLLLFCQDSFKNLEAILSALVHGWPLAVVNSPPSAEQRLRFLQGLLCLLPVPARVGITFALHVVDPSQTAAQVKFLSQRVTPAQHLVYDWGRGQLVSTGPDHSYSHYMIAQLRLDPSLVVEQTAQLSRTAVWRAMHRENLGKALTWVSRRAAIDQTVSQGLPADRDAVAAILREDPTLSEDLRLAYTRHLLAFALALDEPESADVVPTVCAASPELARLIADQLRSAIDGGQAATAYALVERWLLRVPEASALEWHALLQTAMKQRLKNLLRDNAIPEAIALIDGVQKSPPALRLAEIMPDLIRISTQAARSIPPLARALLLMAARSLPAGEFYRMITDESLVRLLPPATQDALSYLQAEPRSPVPPRVLDQGAQALGDGQRALVLGRLVESAMFLQRPSLIDTAGLQALLILAQSSQREEYQALIQQVVDAFSQVSAIQVLEPPGSRVLLQLLLQILDFDGAVGLLEFFQNAVFGPDRLDEFAHFAGDVFRMVALAPQDLNDALTHLEGSPLRVEARVMIYTSALVNRQWAADQDYAARRLTSLIFNDNNLLSTIGHESGLLLLNYHARAQNALDTLRVGAALVDHSLTMGTEGAALITRMWPSITWNPDVTQAAHELVRRFLRGVPLREVPPLIAYFRDQLGAPVGDSLWATAVLRQVMGGTDISAFAEGVQVAAALFIDIASTYDTDKEAPPMHRLRRDLDTLPGGLTEQERRQVAQNTADIPRLIYVLGSGRSRKKGKSASQELLIQGLAVPQNGVDLLRFMGGYFADHQATPLNLKREEMTHILGSRSAAMLLRETNAIMSLLSGLQAAYERPEARTITTKALQDELASLWSTLSLYNQRRMQDLFAGACQQLADVIAITADSADERVVADGGIGRQLETGQRQPHTALEAWRWLHGYFARKHVRTRS